jgi:amino acid adenylation domain-containing protein
MAAKNIHKETVAASQKNRERDYWLEQLAGELSRSSFPPDLAVDGQSTETSFSHYEFSFSEDLASRIVKLTGNADPQLFLVFQAAVVVLLARYSGNLDIITGTSIMKQRQEGAFTNTVLPLRYRLNPDSSFKELLISGKGLLMEAINHQSYPFSVLAQQLQPSETNDGGCPLFDVAVILDTIQTTDYFDGLLPNLLFVFSKNGGELTGSITYNDALYSREFMARIAGHLCNLLERSLEDVNAQVLALDFLTDKERDFFLNDINNTSRDYSGPQTLHRTFAAQAERAPDTIALVENDMQLSYSELDRRSGIVAHTLHNRGVGPDSIVACGIEPSIDGTVALLGILKAGGAYLPLDQDAPDSRNRMILEDCLPKLVLEDIQEISFSERSPVYLDQDARPENLAYVIYTSGTTGVPKGVLVEHGGVVNLLNWYGPVFSMAEGLHVMQLTDYTFDPSVEDVFGSLLFGATVFTGAQHLVGDPEGFRGYVDRHRVNFIDFVPSILSDLLVDRPKLKSLQAVISGGEALSDGLKDKLRQKGYRVFNNYGPTELTVDALSGECGDGGVTLGIPVANAKCYVLNHHNTLQPIGVPGELCVAGACVARGYLNNPEATTGVFADDPFDSGSKMYRTGDLVRVDSEGRLLYLGRVDRQIKINGVRIEPGDIESVLDSHPLVVQSAVTTKTTANGKALCSYIVPGGNTMDIGGERFFLATVAQDPTLEEKIERLHLKHWPAFFVGDKINTTYWKKLYSLFPQFQLAIVSDDGTVAAAGNTIPLSLGGNGDMPSGWDAALLRGMEDHEAGRPATTLCGLVAIVDPSFKGKGMSYKAIEAMKRLLATLEFDRLIIPVRPTFKEKFPELSIQDYCARVNDDGFSEDPWLRVHQKLGGRVSDYCPQSQKIEGTLEQWAVWTGKEFDTTGQYIVPGAMQPVEIDVQNNTGVYIDQAVWVDHTPGETVLNPVDAAVLKDYLLQRLPGPMIPSRFYFLSHLPLNANGKVDYAKLPDIGVQEDEASMAAPLTRVERKLADIWAEVLNIDKGKIGVRHNFFELGGHSLRATILVALIQQRLHARVSMKDIFQMPTIRQLAQFVEEGRKIEYTGISPAEKREYYPLSSAQTRLYFIHQIDAGGISYNMPMILKTAGELDTERLTAAFRSLIQRHETFRTSFRQLEGEGVVQVVHDAVDFSIDYHEASETEGDAMAERFVRPFDLSKAPLLRVGLVNLGKESHILMIDMHHIVSDGTSIDLFINECFRLYNRESLPAVTSQYRDFCMWQSRLFQSGEIKMQEEYWLEQFETPITPLALPTDFHVPHLRTFDGDVVQFTPGPEIDSAVYRLVEESRSTVFMCLLAVYYVLLARYTGNEDIVIGTKLLGRRHADLHQMIGMFINMLALRNYPSSGKTFREFLAEVRENTVNAFENQDYQFEELVGKLGLGGRHGRNPLFDTVFALVNLDNPGPKTDATGADGLTFAPHSTRREISNFDLHLEGVDANGAISLQLGYSTELYKRDTIQSLARRYLEILEQVSANPDIQLKDITIAHQLTTVSSASIAEDEGEFGF